MGFAARPANAARADTRLAEVSLCPSTRRSSGGALSHATAQQRSVIDAIALNWDPITSHDLSAKAGIEITTTSSHLNRMRKEGFIEEVATSGTRSGYQLAERFLNIWYLMRHGTRRARLRLQWLTKFLSRLYGAEELGRMARQARNEVGSCARRTQHADFPHCALLFASPQGLWGLSCRSGFRRWSNHSVAIEQLPDYREAVIAAFQEF